MSSTPPAATRPAKTFVPGARRAATRNADTTATIPAARTTTSQSAGAALPKIDRTVVTATGSGLKDGPPGVLRSRWATSRPQTIQAQGSYAGEPGRTTRDTAATASAAATRTSGSAAPAGATAREW